MTKHSRLDQSGDCIFITTVMLESSHELEFGQQEPLRTYTKAFSEMVEKGMHPSGGVTEELGWESGATTMCGQAALG